MGFATDAIHAGQEPEPSTGAVTYPIFQTSTYVQDKLGDSKGYDYGRTINPTRTALEANIAALEGGRFGIAFGSGMAATSALMGLLKAGDHVLVTANVYGGTYRYFTQVMADFGLTFTFIDTREIGNIESPVNESTRMLFVETPTNPMLFITDLRATAELAAARNLVMVVDNTFLSPYFQRPLELGADIVMHSSTKYLNGHSDIIGGILVTNDQGYAERLHFMQKSAGAVPSPFDCWLVLRSTKTLPLRMRQHNANAMVIAEHLEEHAKVRDVIFPGLGTHPEHDLASRQQLDPYGEPGYGGMISIELGSLEAARAVVNSVKVFFLAESLGGVESLIGHPASQTHASVPREEREAMGLTDGLVRLSVGVEDVDDLIADLDQALEKA